MIEIALKLATDLNKQADTQTLEKIFKAEIPFLEAVKQFDEWASAFQFSGDDQEYLFDLLLAHHIETQRDKEAYFDSAAWQTIEDQTLERGTELLTCILYIAEALESEVDIDLTDFLYEFLLVDEDGFQDEHHIYETIIEQVELIEEVEENELPGILAKLESDELGALQKPLLLFFKSPHSPIAYGNHFSKTEAAIYHVLLSLTKRPI